MSPQPKTLEEYYLTKPEPYQSCLLALRAIILHTNPDICHVRKYQIPFFTYKDNKLGYLWLNGKKLMLGFCVDRKIQVEINPDIKPKDKYESIQINPNTDLPVELILQKLNYYIGLVDKA